MIPPKLQKGDPFGKVMTCWNMLIDHLNEIRLVAGSGISITRRPAGTILSAQSAAGGGGVSAAAAQTGPFAVELIYDDKGSATVTLYNSGNPSGETAGLVTIGSFMETVKKQTFAPKQGVVFLDITYNAEADKYTCSFALESKLPETRDEKRYIYRIAEISYDSSTKEYKSTQLHPVGDIDVRGRWVK